MAKVTTMSGIASISGRLGNYCFRTMRKSGKVYMHTLPSKKPGPAKAPVTADELAARARFEAVSKAVALRRKDLMQISNDQAAFVAQRDKAGGKKTMTAYLWSVCGAAYDAEHGA